LSHHENHRHGKRDAEVMEEDGGDIEVIFDAKRPSDVHKREIFS
jgi:hypothetical protein